MIALWTGAVSHLHHEIKVVNIWLLFIRLLALKRLKFLFFSNRLKSLTGQPSLILAKSDVSLLSIEIKVFFSKKSLKKEL